MSKILQASKMRKIELAHVKREQVIKRGNLKVAKRGRRMSSEGGEFT